MVTLMISSSSNGFLLLKNGLNSLFPVRAFRFLRSQLYFELFVGTLPSYADAAFAAETTIGAYIIPASAAAPVRLFSLFLFLV
jgi:hypothetical protein